MTIYYVSNGGLDTNNGTSSSTPKQHLSAINALTLAAGDQVLGDASSTFYGDTDDPLVPTTNGSSGNPITFGRYGTGAGPTIRCTIRATSGWTFDAGFVYYRTGVASDPFQVFQSGARLLRATSRAAMVQGSWWWDSATLRLYVWQTTSANPSGGTVEYPRVDSGNYRSCCEIGGRSWLTFAGWIFEASAKDGVNGRNGTNAVSSNVIFDHCQANWNAQRGFDFGQPSGAGTARHSSVQIIGCTGHDGTGEFIWGGFGTVTVDGWECWNIGKDRAPLGALVQIGEPSGVRMGVEATNCYIGYGKSIDGVYQGPAVDVEWETGFARPNGTVVERNKIVSSLASAQGYPTLNEMGDNTIVRRNEIVGQNDQWTVFKQGGTGSKYLNNTFQYEKFAYGLRIEAAATGTTVENNIFWNQATNASWFTSGPISVAADSQTGSVFNLNLFYTNGANTSGVWQWGTPTYGTIAAWRTASGQDANSLSGSDPLLRARTSYDLRLQSTSPARNAGMVVSGTTDGYEGSAPDIGAWEYATGSFSDVAENKILDHILGGPDWLLGTTIYAALFVVPPRDDGTGGREMSGWGYARAAVTRATAWNAASGGSKTNASAIAWPAATNNWGYATGIGFFDASSGGNLICWAELATSAAVLSGTTPQVAAGTVTATAD